MCAIFKPICSTQSWPQQPYQQTQMTATQYQMPNMTQQQQQPAVGYTYNQQAYAAPQTQTYPVYNQQTAQPYPVMQQTQWTTTQPYMGNPQYRQW